MQCICQHYCEICAGATVRTDSTLLVAASAIGMLHRVLLGEVTVNAA